MTVEWSAILWFWFFIYFCLYLWDLINYSLWTHKEYHKFQGYRVIIGGIFIFIMVSYWIGHMAYGFGRY